MSSDEGVTDLQWSLRDDYTPFNLPTIEEVILGIDAAFPEDGGKIIQPYWGKGQRIFRIVLTIPVSDLPQHPVIIRTVPKPPSFPPPGLFRGRVWGWVLEGLLVTFRNANLG